MQEPQITIEHNILQLIASIDEFKGQWQTLQILSPEHLQHLRKVATIESIGSSTRIEGSKFNNEQVESLLKDINITSFHTRDEQEVAGYAKAMNLVFDSYKHLNLNENHIRQLHQTLLCYSSKDERHRGSYKTLPNHVVAKDANGRELGVVFETTTPFDTPKEMADLVRWTSNAFAKFAMHPLLIIAVFEVVFLAIYPFQDGNGRLSRILTTLLLLRTGYEYVPYTSLESIIEENKGLYYRALRNTQITLKKNDTDWQSWLDFFLYCLREQKTRLAIIVEQAKNIDISSLPLLSIEIIKLLRKHERLSTAQIVEYTGASKNTLKIRLRELVNEGHIQRNGKARATWYSMF